MVIRIKIETDYFYHFYQKYLNYFNFLDNLTYMMIDMIFWGAPIKFHDMCTCGCNLHNYTFRTDIFLLNDQNNFFDKKLIIYLSILKNNNNDNNEFTEAK